jgi:hypothetical protein
MISVAWSVFSAALTNQQSPFTSSSSALVQQDAIKSGRDAGFCTKLSAPILWDGVDPEVRA